MTIKNGSKVSIHYRLTVDDQVVDSSEGKDPLSYEHGAGQIIPGLEKELEGMKAGDKKKVTVSPEEGYGHRDPAQIQKVPITAFAEPDKLKVGGTVRGQAGDQMFTATVIEIGKDEVTLDTNHPLAGKELNFEIEIVDVK